MSRRRREIPIFRTAETLRPSDAIEHDVSPHGTANADTIAPALTGAETNVFDFNLPRQGFPLPLSEA